MVAARWIIKTLGFFSTIILARLLIPADFGIVAMALIVVGLTQILFEMNVDTAIIQNPKADESYFNTAWTIRIIQSLIVSTLVLAMSPLAAYYYEESRVLLVIQALSFGILINGFSNIGVVTFRKELQFNKEFLFLLFTKLVSFIPTVLLAFLWRNYWALVIGMLSGNIATVIFSYLMHPFRPRFSLKKFKEVWGFSQWVLIHNIGYYTYTRVDQIIVGGIANSASLGTYSVASELAELPTTELIYPLSRVIVPGYAKLKHDPQRLKAAYLKVLAVVAVFSLPTAAGLAIVADEVVDLILGVKWLEAIPILQWLALYAGLRPIYGTVWNLALALGKTRQLAALTWIELACLAPTIWLGAQINGVIGVATAKVIVTAIMPVLYFGFLIHFKFVTLLDIVTQLWRPAFSTIVMTAAVIGFSAAFSNVPIIMALIAKVTVGAAIYLVVLLVIWYLAGRPIGVEDELIKFIAGRLRPRRRSDT